jgi:uncharacterized membrane protein
MKWYHSAIKRMLNGVFLFLLPVMLLFFIMGKAIGLMQAMIQPIKKFLPEERILGVGMVTLISVILILLLCYLAGILIEGRKVKVLIAKLEDNVLIYVPGYSMLKRQTHEAIGDTDKNWQAVLLHDDEEWKLGITVDRQPSGYCTVFFPEPPDAKQGEMKLLHESRLKKLDIPVSQLVRIIRRYGQGSAELIKKGKIVEANKD